MIAVKQGQYHILVRPNHAAVRDTVTDSVLFVSKSGTRFSVQLHGDANFGPDQKTLSEMIIYAYKGFLHDRQIGYDMFNRAVNGAVKAMPNDLSDASIRKAKTSTPWSLQRVGLFD